MGHSREVRILGPKRRPGEASCSQDDPVRHRQIAGVREPCGLQRKCRRKGNLATAAHRRGDAKCVVLTAPAQYDAEYLANTHGWIDEPALVGEWLGEHVGIGAVGEELDPSSSSSNRPCRRAVQARIEEPP